MGVKDEAHGRAEHRDLHAYRGEVEHERAAESCRFPHDHVSTLMGRQRGRPAHPILQLLHRFRPGVGDPALLPVACAERQDQFRHLIERTAGLAPDIAALNERVENAIDGGARNACLFGKSNDRRGPAFIEGSKDSQQSIVNRHPPL